MLLRFNFFGYANSHNLDTNPRLKNNQRISVKKTCQIGKNGNTRAAFGTMPIATTKKAGLAQLVEQLICNQ